MTFLATVFVSNESMQMMLGGSSFNDRWLLWPADICRCSTAGHFAASLQLFVLGSERLDDQDGMPQMNHKHTLCLGEICLWNIREFGHVVRQDSLT
jgi:hypothetical protein